WTRAGIPASVVKPYLTDDNQLTPLVLRPGAERLLREGFQRGDSIGSLSLDPAATRVFVDAVVKALELRGAGSGRPAILTAQDLRRHVPRLLERTLPHWGVLSFAEIPSTLPLSSTVPVECEPAAPAGARRP